MSIPFPEVSSKTSIAAPILVSPILGSYERVCIGAVSVIGLDVEVGVIGLPDQLAKMSYQINLIAMQLKNHLEAGKTIDEFVPMIADFYVGPEQYGQFGTHERAIKTILRNHCFLYRGE